MPLCDGERVPAQPSRPRSPSHRRILVVDDDARTIAFLHELLTMEGYAVDEARDGPTGLAKVATFAPDLVLLDVMMPGQDGLDALAELRRTTDVPVIMVTAKAHESDRVVGLRLGADDYVVKPFSAAELVARISSVLRRSGAGRRAAKLDFEGLAIDLASRQVVVEDAVVDMPAREYELLVFMASSPGHVFSRRELLEAVWDASAGHQQPSTVTEHIRRVRARIERDPDAPRWIRTVRGTGYRFDP